MKPHEERMLTRCIGDMWQKSQGYTATRVKAVADEVVRTLADTHEITYETRTLYQIKWKMKPSGIVAMAKATMTPEQQADCLSAIKQRLESQA